MRKATTAEKLLQRASALQTEFWEALSELEKALDVEIDGTRDLCECSIEDLATESSKKLLEICAECREPITSKRGVQHAEDGAAYHGRCWNNTTPTTRSKS